MKVHQIVLQVMAVQWYTHFAAGTLPGDAARCPWRPFIDISITTPDVTASGSQEYSMYGIIGLWLDCMWYNRPGAGLFHLLHYFHYVIHAHMLRVSLSVISQVYRCSLNFTVFVAWELDDPNLEIFPELMCFTSSDTIFAPFQLCSCVRHVSCVWGVTLIVSLVCTSVI